MQQIPVATEPPTAQKPRPRLHRYWCPFCFLGTLSPSKPAPSRKSPERWQFQVVIPLLLLFFIPSSVLPAFAIRVMLGTSSDLSIGSTLLTCAAFIAACTPLAGCLGFVVSWAYYFLKLRKEEKEEKEKNGEKEESVGQDQDPDGGKIEVVVEPARDVQHTVQKNRGLVQSWWNYFNGKLGRGYDGRVHRSVLWEAEQIEMRERSDARA